MNRDEANKSRVPARQFGLAALLFIGLLLLAASHVTSRDISYLLYYLNWCHWPWWYAINLWIVAVGCLLARFVVRRKMRYSLYAITLIAVTAVTAACSEWGRPLLFWGQGLFNRFYLSIIRPYFYAPVTNFFSDGTVSWQLVILPVAVSVLIVLILIGRHSNPKARNNGSKTEEGAE